MYLLAQENGCKREYGQCNNAATCSLTRLIADIEKELYDDTPDVDAKCLFKVLCTQWTSKFNLSYEYIKSLVCMCK